MPRRRKGSARRIYYKGKRRHGYVGGWAGVNHRKYGVIKHGIVGDVVELIGKGVSAIVSATKKPKKPRNKFHM